jgi:hypothetical protein
MKLLEKTIALCLLAAGAAFAAPAAAQEFKLPDGKAALHYFRADGSYDGWGLHTWESYQAKSEAGDEFAKKQQADRPLAAVTWFAPIKPSGKDDFGIYWILSMDEYQNGRVNYIIHKGDKKDQCNKDMFWLLKDSREAWVVSGDCKVYLTKEDAQKAMKK